MKKLWYQNRLVKTIQRVKNIEGVRDHSLGYRYNK